MLYKLLKVIGLLGWMLTGTSPAAPAPDQAGAAEGTDARWSAEDFRAEVEALYTGLQAAHFDLYARRPRAAYDAQYQQLRKAARDGMSRTEVETRLRRFVAYGRVAHARIDWPTAAWEQYRGAGGKGFPLALGVVAGAVRVLDNPGGVAGIRTGDRVLRIDGQPARAWLDRLRVEVAADNDYMAYTLMESLVPLLAWLEHGPRTHYRLRVQGKTGPARDYTVPTLTRADIQAYQTTRGESTEAPAWDRREARVLEPGLAYLRPGPFFDTSPGAANPWDPSAFVAFVDAAFAQILEAQAHTLLIDLRDNPGGDNSFSDPLLAWFADRPFRFCSQFKVRSSVAARASNRERLDLQPDPDPDSVTARYEAAYAAHPPGSTFDFPMPDHPPRQAPRYTGKVYLLINRHSYSNTVFVAAMAQDYGFATLIGEETSDLASTYGAMEHFVLPRSGLRVGFPKAHIVRPSGDTSTRGVIPDVPLPRVLGEDEAAELARAIALLKQHAGQD